MGEKPPTCARWHYQWVKGMVGRASGWHKDPVPTAQTQVESGDLMECVPRVTGGANDIQRLIRDKSQVSDGIQLPARTLSGLICICLNFMLWCEPFIVTCHIDYQTACCGEMSWGGQTPSPVGSTVWTNGLDCSVPWNVTFDGDKILENRCPLMGPDCLTDSWWILLLYVFS